MKKFKLIIAPSSNDERAFESSTTFDEAKKVIEQEGIESAQEFSFDTEKERAAFLEGYHAAIGYNGDGLFYVKDEEEPVKIGSKQRPHTYGIEAEGRKFARQCDATGEGMDEGFCVGDGEMYFKYEKDFLKHLKEETDYKTKEEAYEDEYYYHTAWEDEGDFQYVVKDGELVDIE